MPSGRARSRLPPAPTTPPSSRIAVPGSCWSRCRRRPGSRSCWGCESALMRVATEDLPRHSGVVTMVDGGFDPIHAGHVEYFRAAAELGAPVLCNISSDHWVSRKHTPLLPQDERAAVIDAFRWISFTTCRALPPSRFSTCSSRASTRRDPTGVTACPRTSGGPAMRPGSSSSSSTPSRTPRPDCCRNTSAARWRADPLSGHVGQRPHLSIER